MAAVADLRLVEEDVALLGLGLGLVEGPLAPAPMEVAVARAGQLGQAAPAGAARRSVRRPSERVRSVAQAVPAPAQTAALGRTRPIQVGLPTDSSRRRGVLVLVEVVVEATEEGADRASEEVVGVEEVEHLPLVVHLVVLVLLGVDRPSEAVAIAACMAVEVVTVTMAPSRPFVTLLLCTVCWNPGWTRARALLAVVAAEEEEGINSKAGRNRRPSP